MPPCTSPLFYFCLFKKIVFVLLQLELITRPPIIMEVGNGFPHVSNLGSFSSMIMGGNVRILGGLTNRGFITLWKLQFLVERAIVNDRRWHTFSLHALGVHRWITGIIAYNCYFGLIAAVIHIYL